MAAHHKSPHGPAATPSTRGIVLVVVLLSIAIMSVIVMALSAFMQRNLAEVSVEADRLRSEFALRSGLETAKAFVAAREARQRALFDGTPFDAGIGGGLQVTIAIRDAAGLVDLNRADPKLIEAVAAAAGLPADQASSLAAKIAELRKAAAAQNPEATPQAPARTRAAATATTADDTADQAGDQSATADETPAQEDIEPVFFSPAQLRQIIDMSENDYDKILPFIGLYSATGKINPLAAPDLVLESIPGMAPGDIETFAGARRSGQWESDARIKEIQERLKDFVEVSEAKAFAIDVTLRSGAGIIAGRKVSAVVLLGSGRGMPFQTLAFSW
ncbi:MAG: general secretion pathway protein GspK [Alphaproteobacteria bacterium]|nr:general secretion pathway protein GspK [Alphaproteobacteria bacterium]